MVSQSRTSARKRHGRRVLPGVRAELAQWLDGKPKRRDLLLEYLHILQDRLGHLPRPHLAALAEWLGLAQAEVYEVASFYHHFDIVREGDSPPPTLTVRVCDSITCKLFGAEDLIEQLQKELPQVRIQRVPCVGRCEQAPVAMVGQAPVAPACVRSVQQCVEHGDHQEALPKAVSYADYCSQGGYAQYTALMSGELSVDQVIEQVRESGLRGLGGAGFEAARKWDIVRGYPGPRMLAVNIDEGEPGTFKDRYYLERSPHPLLEGMLIAAAVVQAEQIYLYVRDEYPGIRRLLQQELQILQAALPGPLPTLELRRGAGAYICGEESAMIESIEGRRGMPRLRPPYIAEFGLFGRPTLEHNMETLYWLPQILERGADWYRGHGLRGCSGLRSFSLSGRVCAPGVYLAPAGTTVRELIDEYGGGMLEGHEFYGYFPGGASGGLLPASLGDLPLDFGTLEEHGCFLGSGAIIVLSDKDSARAAACNAMEFFAHESCGRCTPCRVGTAKAAGLMQAEHWDRTLLDELSVAMRDASICGLGQAAPNPLQSVLRYFSHEVD